MEQSTLPMFYVPYYLMYDIEGEASDEFENFIAKEENELNQMSTILNSINKEICNEEHFEDVYSDDVQSAFYEPEVWYYECDTCQRGPSECNCIHCVTTVSDVVFDSIRVKTPYEGKYETRLVPRTVRYPQAFMM